MKKKSLSVISFPVSFCLLVRKMVGFMVACLEWLSGGPAVEHQSESEPHFLCSPVSLLHVKGKKSLELLKCGMNSELATSLLTLAPLQVLDDWIEDG